MGKDLTTQICFAKSPADFDMAAHTDYVVHALCARGSFSFLLRDVRYNVAPNDYVILPNPSLASAFSQSADFEGLVMALGNDYVAAIALRSDYGAVGHLALLHNPVMRLSATDAARCRSDLERLRERLGETEHRFRDEMVGHLLMAHILDLYDIHARSCAATPPTERKASLLRRFVALLCRGDCAAHRDLAYYAGKLCVSPHYLSEVCREVSGQPASYWIDRFTVQTIIRMLEQKDLSLTEIAARLHFSSLSYFSRYVARHTGRTPTAYRDSASPA